MWGEQPAESAVMSPSVLGVAAKDWKVGIMKLFRRHFGWAIRRTPKALSVCSSLLALFPLVSTWHDSASVVFHYTWVPPNVHRVIIPTWSKGLQRYLYPTQTTQQWRTSRWRYILVAGLQKWPFWFLWRRCSHDLQWHYWPVKQWHAVNWHHIFGSTESILEPQPSTRY